MACTVSISLVVTGSHLLSSATSVTLISHTPAYTPHSTPPAYGSGEARAAYRKAGHDTVIKPGLLRPAVPGGFTLDDFTLDQDAGTVTCPAGVTRPMSKTRTVTFGAACAGCPLRPRCTTRKDGRPMTIHPHEHLPREARAQARTEAFKRAYPTRSVIERIIAWTAIQNGRRVRLRYFGAAKNDAWSRA